MKFQAQHLTEELLELCLMFAADWSQIHLSLMLRLEVMVERLSTFAVIQSSVQSSSVVFLFQALS